jgi:hypothetical protein
MQRAISSPAREPRIEASAATSMRKLLAEAGMA